VTRRLALAVAAAAAAAAALAGCGGPSAPPWAVAPAWHPPVASGPAGAPAFCAALASDLAHLRDPAETRTTRAVEGDFAGLFDALPSLVSLAPPSIRPSVAIWAKETTAVYQALLERSIDHPGSHQLTLDSTVPLSEASAAVHAVGTWAAASCHPDPLS
jgi:hypothetical protein